MGSSVSVEVEKVARKGKAKLPKSQAASEPDGFSGSKSSSSRNHHASANPQPMAARTTAAQPQPELAACNSGGSSGRSGTGSVRKFKLQELRQGTKGFSSKNVLGEGSFGKVFEGTVTSGGIPTSVAVKVLNKNSFQGIEELVAEVHLLSNVSHPNLIKLLGFCVEKEYILVYELCENGSLWSRMFPEVPNVPAMTWGERVKVMQGVGNALKHLHENKIVHRDLKPPNVLLDRENTPKVSDFGMAKLVTDDASTRIMGTMGYLDPHYMETGVLRDASDVYSFGVIMLQLLSRKDALDSSSTKLTDWFKKYVFPTMADPSMWMDKALNDKYPKSGALQVAKIAERCVATLQVDRPDMEWVVEKLNSVPID